MTSNEDLFDAQWSLATLNDAKEALEALIAQIEDNPDEVQEILEEDIANVYAKLNYAFNSAELGSNALMQMEDDDLIAFPAVLPFKHGKVNSQEAEEDLN
ncbi:MAG: hypothetical protein IJ022_00895 [Burkholderiaceae bacterium]|nr:hypothetical protein [Burkholderiaceae bacterium]